RAHPLRLGGDTLLRKTKPGLVSISCIYGGPHRMTICPVLPRTYLPARLEAKDRCMLFDPMKLGAIKLPNRIVMAPLTRARSGREGVPNEMMAAYYAQRAGAGLIITEATGISREGLGWPNAPGLWTAEQVLGWKQVTEAVHRADGRIVAQLWHMGRLVH